MARRLADPAGGDALLAQVDHALQEGARGQHHGGRPRYSVPLTPDDARRRGRPLDDQILDRVGDRTSRFGVRGQVGLHGLAVEACGRSGPGGPRTAGALGAVQQAELDAGPVGQTAHQRRRGRRSRGPDGPCPGRRWPGCRTSRRWSRGVWVSSRRARAEAGRGRGGLAAGVPAADDDDVPGAQACGLHAIRPRNEAGGGWGVI